jgi:hypothetical protein
MSNVDLFTKEEHAIIAASLGVAPICDESVPLVKKALADLGFDGPVNMRRNVDAALGGIVLERVQENLPQYASFREMKSGETHVTWGREIKARWAHRKVEIVPRHLFTINWANSGPGISWPVAYHVTYLPIYDAHVVTESADCPDVFGYCDFAIGHFKPGGTTSAADIVKQDWQWSLDTWDQTRWEELFWPGLISIGEAERMADEVWADEQ